MVRQQRSSQKSTISRTKSCLCLALPFLPGTCSFTVFFSSAACFSWNKMIKRRVLWITADCWLFATVCCFHWSCLLYCFKCSSHSQRGEFCAWSVFLSLCLSPGTSLAFLSLHLCFCMWLFQQHCSPLHRGCQNKTFQNKLLKSIFNDC